MRKFALLLLISLGTFLSAQPIFAQPTSRPTPASRPSVVVPFDLLDGYFVSNKFEPDKSESFAVIYDQDTFDGMFGAGFVMNDKSHRLPPDAFETKSVIAVIKRGNAIWKFSDVQVTLDQAVLKVRYSAEQGKADAAQYSCPLIISVPRSSGFDSVQLEENGKLVKTIEKTWWDVKQEAARDAEREDAELNKVYKELMAVLDDDEKKRLVTSERAWIAYRDAECEFVANYTGSGTDREVNYPGCAAALTKVRIAELRQQLVDRTPKK